MSSNSSVTLTEPLSNLDGFAEEPRPLSAERQLVVAVHRLSMASSLEELISIVADFAKQLTGADGAAFVLRDKDLCFYADERAIGPLWKGQRFPMTTCISGWAMLNKTPVVVPDIYKDSRIPIDAYRPTFVKSLAIVPIRTESPLGAIGNYWATDHHATAEEMSLLQALADSTSVALENLQLIESLKQAVSLRDEFLSIASHELKTPLTPMRLQLQIGLKILEKAEMANDLRRSIAMTLEGSLKQVDRQVNLVESLLDVSRISSGAFHLYLEMADLSQLVLDVAKHFQPEFERLGVQLTTEVEPGLQMRCDPMRMEQVMNNLLTNALKYGGKQPVLVELKRHSDKFSISVIDQGGGIEPAHQEIIFNRFERGSSSMNLGGLGLGLYISRKIVELHGGKVFVQSTVGQGSIFRVELPL